MINMCFELDVPIVDDPPAVYVIVAKTFRFCQAGQYKALLGM